MMKPSGECSLERQRFWNEKEKRKRKGEEEEGEERRRRMEEGEEKIDKILESEQVQSTGQWQSPEQKVSNCRNSRSSWKKASTTRRGTRASTARGSVLGGISPTQPSERTPQLAPARVSTPALPTAHGSLLSSMLEKSFMPMEQLRPIHLSRSSGWETLSLFLTLYGLGSLIRSCTQLH